MSRPYSRLAHGSGCILIALFSGAQAGAQTPTPAAPSPAAANAASMERHAELAGAPPDAAGKCTIEVEIDVRAEVQIQDESALLRNLGGKRPEWKRFQCTNPMPLHPAGFRLTKVAGRGRIKLTVDPSNGDPATVLLEDPDTGTGIYIFDISWTAPKEGKPLVAYAKAKAKDPEVDRKPVRAPERGFVTPFEPDEALRACEDAAIDRALERYHAQAVTIRKSAIDTAPDRNEWVLGTLETRRGKDWDTFRFTCNADFRTRNVRSVTLDATGPRAR